MKLADVTKCKECGSTELSWHTHKKVHNDIPQGRLNSADISMLFVLGCDDCAETLAVINSSKVAELLNEEFAAAPLPQVQSEALTVELIGVSEQIEEGAGFWHSCSGCYDTEDGHPTGPYSYSPVLRCALGSGCAECGGLGACWDNNDYSDAADQQPVTPSGALADNDGGVA